VIPLKGSFRKELKKNSRETRLFGGNPDIVDKNKNLKNTCFAGKVHTFSGK
jgi:hypothetical protein